MEACSKHGGLTGALKCVAPAAIRRTVLAVLLVSLTAAARYRTPNFIVEATDPNFAAQVAQAAENYRRQLAIEWLGKELPNWSQPCPITVNVGANLGAGGATTFVFDRGTVTGWRMSIQGPPDRLLDSVLPHEITHMIFASHFRRPLPRWADEGAATTVEHPSERRKYYLMLHQFLRSGQGISFSQMFAMKDYPPNPMPLYAQSYSLADYLIQLGGRRKYVEFVGDGLSSGDWAGAVRRNYGISDLGQLQNTWLAWVRQGSPPLRPRNSTPEGTRSEPLLAAAGQPGAATPPKPIGQAVAPVAPAAPPAGVGAVSGATNAGSLAGGWQPAVRPADTLAANGNAQAGKLPRPEPNLLVRVPAAHSDAQHSQARQHEPVQPRTVVTGPLVPVERLPPTYPGQAQPEETKLAVAANPRPSGGSSQMSEPAALWPAGWRAAGSAPTEAAAAAVGSAPTVATAAPLAEQAAPPTFAPLRNQLTRPQDAQGPRHIIIQWGTR